MEDTELHNRPTLVAKDIPPLAHQLYGLEFKVVRELDSFDDQNFLVHVIPETNIPEQISDPCSHGYVFKVLNPIDSRKADVIDLQTHAIVHSVQSGIPTAKPIKTRTGVYQTLMKVPQASGLSDEPCLVRLFEYLPGQILSQVRLTSHLCRQLGTLAAQQDIALKDFVPEDERVLSKMGNKWCMGEIPRLRDILGSIGDRSQIDLVSEVINVFTTRVIDCQDSFSRGLIHGDMNEANIIVSETAETAFNNVDGKDDQHSEQSQSSPDTTTSSSIMARDNGIDSDHSSNSKKKVNGIENNQSVNQVVNITGVIDYGDMKLSLYLYEISIAMMYVMISENTDVTAMAAGGHVLAGYLSHHPLPSMELESLRVCLCARMVQSFTLGHYAHSRDPGNEYTLIHARRLWPLLNQLWSMSDTEFLLELKPFCDEL